MVLAVREACPYVSSDPATQNPQTCGAPPAFQLPCLPFPSIPTLATLSWLVSRHPTSLWLPGVGR